MSNAKPKIIYEYQIKWNGILKGYHLLRREPGDFDWQTAGSPTKGQNYGLDCRLFPTLQYVVRILNREIYGGGVIRNWKEPNMN